MRLRSRNCCFTACTEGPLSKRAHAAGPGTTPNRLPRISSNRGESGVLPRSGDRGGVRRELAHISGWLQKRPGPKRFAWNHRGLGRAASQRRGRWLAGSFQTRPLAHAEGTSSPTRAIRPATLTRPPRDGGGLGRRKQEFLDVTVRPGLGVERLLARNPSCLVVAIFCCWAYDAARDSDSG